MGVLQCHDQALQIGTRTLIMGILNVTPDSFSDGGDFISVDKAVERAKQMEAEGADILDIGGESTRPGADKVTLAEELRRVIPVVQAIRAAVSLPVSVDTYKAEVARQALEAGAHIINDVWGLKGDEAMAEVIVHYRCPVILMHNRKVMNYADFLADVVEDMQANIQFAVDAGIDPSQIILDPGIGFAKSYEQNLELMNHLNGLVALGYPVLLGTSRKSMITKTLELPADDVIAGTAATVALGIAQGCEIIRVHDIEQMKRVARMTDAIVRRG
ncbi:dihydropteroate synthase [Paenibacillus psychroresistens]|uniref:Dihydropteroate synthase n=1 Tax=Paenibacillus psychroresistens TaxID=1778678 RepID=A0A6B8RDU7_9BACL|nr:dihydropteroate synthase [Paenibacillus psychroresistens]QGQ93713.1 dihydropteroate synthase [Paenibacillus psychroresistens]